MASSLQSAGQQKSSKMNNKNWKGNTGSGQSSGSSASTSGSSPPKRHAKHLGPNGKLKPKELERCQKFDLCIFCGGKHKLEDCMVHKPNSSSQLHGRAAGTQGSELLAIAEVPEK